MSNHGLFEITKLEEAQQAWEIFFSRFYSPELSKQVNVEFDPKQREFIPRKLNKLKIKILLGMKERAPMTINQPSIQMTLTTF